LNIFVQGFETDFGGIRDGVGIVSKRFDPSDDAIDFGQQDTSRGDNYTIAYTITCQNHAPVANAGGPYTGIRGFPVPFDGSQSAYPDSRSISYEWDFGDGTSGSGIKPIHTYNQEGAYQVTLGVRDEHCETSASSSTVTVHRDAPSDFTVKCQQDSIAIFAGGENRQTLCTVASLNSFAGTVDLRCESPTNPHITCTFSPIQVTPPPNGSIGSILTVGADIDSPFGTYDLKITATSEGRTFIITIRVEVLLFKSIREISS
jgi:PKD domain-containing protein